MNVILLLFLVVYVPCLVLSQQLNEKDRREEYKKRGYKWPMDTYEPNTTGWRELMNRRFHQVQHISDIDQRYQGWLVTAISAYVQQNFTQYGW